MKVRRGDYFGAFADRYSFDEATYLLVALERQFTLGGPARAIHVVSDGLDWCRARLGWMAEHAELTFQPEDSTPQQDLTTLASARRLVITHSSFGFWGAHLSNALYGDNEHLVVAPWFHDRSMRSGEASQLNPAWTVIRHIPGGWGPEPIR